jgi:hypothetical protein
MDPALGNIGVMKYSSNANNNTVELNSQLRTHNLSTKDIAACRVVEQVKLGLIRWRVFAASCSEASIDVSSRCHLQVSPPHARAPDTFSPSSHGHNTTPNPAYTATPLQCPKAPKTVTLRSRSSQA